MMLDGKWQHMGDAQITVEGLTMFGNVDVTSSDPQILELLGQKNIPGLSITMRENPTQGEKTDG